MTGRTVAQQLSGRPAAPMAREVAGELDFMDAVNRANTRPPRAEALGSLAFDALSGSAGNVQERLLEIFGVTVLDSGDPEQDRLNKEARKKLENDASFKRVSRALQSRDSAKIKSAIDAVTAPSETSPEQVSAQSRVSSGGEMVISGTIKIENGVGTFKDAKIRRVR